MTHDAAAEDYEAFLRRARADDNVVGLIIVGPHAANAYVTPDSDYDAYVVLQRQDKSWATPHGSPVEVWPMTVDAFREHAMPGSGDEWNRPTPTLFPNSCRNLSSTPLTMDADQERN